MIGSMESRQPTTNGKETAMERTASTDQIADAYAMWLNWFANPNHESTRFAWKFWEDQRTQWWLWLKEGSK